MSGGPRATGVLWHARTRARLAAWRSHRASCSLCGPSAASRGLPRRSFPTLTIITSDQSQSDHKKRCHRATAPPVPASLQAGRVSVMPAPASCCLLEARRGRRREPSFRQRRRRSQRAPPQHTTANRTHRAASSQPVVGALPTGGGGPSPPDSAHLAATTAGMMGAGEQHEAQPPGQEAKTDATPAGETRRQRRARAIPGAPATRRRGTRERHPSGTAGAQRHRRHRRCCCVTLYVQQPRSAASPPLRLRASQTPRAAQCFLRPPGRRGP